MKPNMRTVVSCVYIYFLMSVHPIDAARVKVQIKQAETAMEQSQELVQELRKTVLDDTQHAG